MRKAIRQPEPAASLSRNDLETRAGVSFAAPEAVAAITFHLLDEGIATRVCGDSAQRAVRRMATLGAPPAEISRSLWGEMSNPERLAWLLATSELTYAVNGDGVARLDVRGS